MISLGSSSEYAQKKENNTKIDRQEMMRLIHELEKKYHVGDYVNDRQIKFNDETIPNEEPMMIELHKVVSVR